jgi:hypothetical protein
MLKSSSNYERGLEHLDEAGKVTIKKLREWGGDLAKAVGKKRKCTDFDILLTQFHAKLTSEGLLWSFNRQLRLDESKNMIDTVLTKYF